MAGQDELGPTEGDSSCPVCGGDCAGFHSANVISTYPFLTDEQKAELQRDKAKREPKPDRAKRGRRRAKKGPEEDRAHHGPEEDR